MVTNLECFLSLSADFFFTILKFPKNSFRNTIRMSNSLVPDQARQLLLSDDNLLNSLDPDQA